MADELNLRRLEEGSYNLEKPSLHLLADRRFFQVLNDVGHAIEHPHETGGWIGGRRFEAAIGARLRRGPCHLLLPRTILQNLGQSLSRPLVLARSRRRWCGHGEPLRTRSVQNTSYRFDVVPPGSPRSPS